MDAAWNRPLTVTAVADRRTAASAQYVPAWFPAAERRANDRERRPESFLPAEGRAPPAAGGVGRIARAGIIVALVALYYLVPDHSSAAAAITILVIGLVTFIVLVALQVR